MRVLTNETLIKRNQEINKKNNNDHLWTTGAGELFKLMKTRVCHRLKIPMLIT